MFRQKRLFVTGASGYIGSVVTELALGQGYDVYGLSRSETSDRKLEILGAVPVRGDLTSLAVLHRESVAADAVIHLATAYEGLPHSRYEDRLHIDNAAVEAIADGLSHAGTQKMKALVVTAGTLCVAPDPDGKETTESSPLSASTLKPRHKGESFALSLAGSKGIRVISIRLPPYVYGRGGSGVRRMMGMAMHLGSLPCIDGGGNRTTVVHVEDVAKLYLLAMQKGRAGNVFNASSSTEVTSRELLGVVAEVVGVPVDEYTCDEAMAKFGETVTWFLKTENRASGSRARELLGWVPVEMGIVDDVRKGSYVDVAKEMRRTKHTVRW